MEKLLQALGVLMAIVVIWAVLAGTAKVVAALFGEDLDGKTCGVVSCILLAAATMLMPFLP